ncbi:hypothetical protein [Natronospira bacteriovora]|uniref:Uncharacterized protein n=1 Tax=Natronospira bacteriovora TaxID=3069753 RepID=A0ABU0W7A3_9GAMM|nr:hypothetical protein [Natronospira sp. AB-CW4]MDQ2069809.1 hypothetical protein [Natronospira sp. AB-CW4]
MDASSIQGAGSDIELKLPLQARTEVMRSEDSAGETPLPAEHGPLLDTRA